MVGIVGPSGSGKSSVFHILQRLYDPCDGDVVSLLSLNQRKGMVQVLDSCSVEAINPSYLRRNIVAVGQEPTLFSYTIKENITYGLQDAEFTMEDVYNAAKTAKIHDFIVGLPQVWNRFN